MRIGSANAEIATARSDTGAKINYQTVFVRKGMQLFFDLTWGTLSGANFIPIV